MTTAANPQTCAVKKRQTNGLAVSWSTKPISYRGKRGRLKGDDSGFGLFWPLWAFFGPFVFRPATSLFKRGGFPRRSKEAFCVTKRPFWAFLRLLLVCTSLRRTHQEIPVEKLHSYPFKSSPFGPAQTAMRCKSSTS